MKFRIATYLVLGIILSSCDSNDDSSPKFPECVGTTESINPYSITNFYTGKIWGEDTTIHTQFIFADYVDYNVLFAAERSWNMYVKFTSGTSTIYQSFYCWYSFGEYKYYANSGFDYRGKYSNWDFNFETFDCSKLSGICLVSRPDTSDTLQYRFEGIR